MGFFETQASAPVAQHPPQPSSLAECLRYYIVRPGNIMIPLVPADQLPFQLQGIPRELSHQQMFEGGWKPLKETTESAFLLPVQAPAPAPAQSLSQDPMQRILSPKFLAPDHKARRYATGMPEGTLKHNRAQYVTGPSPGSSKQLPEQSRDIGRTTSPLLGDNTASLTDSFANIYQKDAQRFGYRALPPSGVEPDPSKKEFCTHWMKWGECSFMVTGCRYKHEMPPIEKLRELGFTSVPKWWKEKAAIRGPTWMQQRMNQNKENENDQATEPHSPRVFPDPSRFRTHQRDHSEKALGMLKSLAIESEHGILRKENKGETVHFPAQQPEDRVPDLLIDIEAPAPPPSSAGGSSSSTSSVSPPSSPSLTATSATSLPKTPKASEDRRRYIRRLSEISWSSDDGKAAKELLKRKSTLQKGHQSAPLSRTPKKVGLAKSKHAVAADDTTKSPHKPAKDHKSTSSPTLQSQITKLVRAKEDRHRTAVGQVKSALPSKLVK